jgi:ribosomal protein L39E
VLRHTAGALRRIILLPLVVAAAALVPAAAGAHAGNPNFESVIRSVTPSIKGFSVAVLNGDDRLEAINQSDRTVVLEGYGGEPYLRMRPHGGDVDVNTRSEAYYLNQGRFEGVPIPASADNRAAPVWKTLERDGRYQFHDHRIHWMSRTDPKQVRDRSRRTKILDWRVPIRSAGQTGAVAGTLFWRGKQDSSAPVGAYIGLGALIVLGAALVVVTRRRRAAAGGVSEDGADEAW